MTAAESDFPNLTTVSEIAAHNEAQLAQTMFTPTEPNVELFDCEVRVSNPRYYLICAVHRNTDTKHWGLIDIDTNDFPFPLTNEAAAQAVRDRTEWVDGDFVLTRMNEIGTATFQRWHTRYWRRVHREVMEVLNEEASEDACS